MNVDAIMNQYLTDAALAQAAGWISAGTLSKVDAWARRDRRRRLLFRDLASEPPSLRNFLRRVVWNSDLGVREKIALLRVAIRGN